jgi:hypothetical protein
MFICAWYQRARRFRVRTPFLLGAGTLLALGCSSAGPARDASPLTPDAEGHASDANVPDAGANARDGDVSDAGDMSPEASSVWPGPVPEAHRLANLESGRVRSLAVAALPDHVLAAYVQGEDRADATVLRLYLRRLRWDGSALDESSLQAAETTIAPQPRLPDGHVAAASDGTKSLVCWQIADAVTCFVVTDTLALSAGPACAGVTPAVAFGPKGWVLARTVPPSATSTDATAIVSRLDEHFAVDETTRFSRTVAVGADYFGEGPAVTATEGGFVFVAPAAPPSVVLDRLDGALAPVGPPIALGHASWGWLSIASRGDRIAVSMAKPYGASVHLIDGGGALVTTEHMGGGKTGVQVKMLPGATTFEAAWADDQLRPRCCAPFDERHPLADVLTHLSSSPGLVWATYGTRVLAVSSASGALDAWVLR